MTERDGPGTRQRILDMVKAEPGIHKMAVCRALQLSWGTVSYHVRVLSRSGQLSTYSPRGREVRLFPPGTREQQRRWIATVRSGLDPDLVGRLGERPGARLADLSNDLGMSRRIVQRHLLRLGEGGLIRREGGWQGRYELNAEGVEFRANLLGGHGMDDPSVQ